MICIFNMLNPIERKHQLIQNLLKFDLTFLQFTEYGIEGVVPTELLPPDVRSKYQAKPIGSSKRAKKEETKTTENQVLREKTNLLFSPYLAYMFLRTFS